VRVVCKKERRFRFIIKNWIGKRMSPPHPTGKANPGMA